MFGFDTTGLIWLALALIAGLVIVARIRSARSTSTGSTTNHGHSHDHEADKDLDGEFHSAHCKPGTSLPKAHGHKGDGKGCKFDENEVRRTLGQFVPPIDISNLPPRDPMVERLLACVREDELADIVGGLSGEKAVYVGDQHVTLKSRSSHGEGVYLAMTWLEQYYRSLKIAATRLPYKVRGKTYFNLEAKLSGKMTGAKKKIYVFGSHLDSTAGNTWTAEKLAPGADDDASGTVAVLKIAELMNGLQIPDDVEIRFLHFTGEEQGLWGSYRYSTACAEAKEDIVRMWQLDMCGYCRTDEHMFDIHDNVDQNGSHVITVEIFRTIAQYGINLKPIDTHNRAVENRSDHAGFLDHGYKAVLVSERFTDEDFTPYYHTVEDRVNKFRLPFYANIVRAMLANGINVIGLTAKK